MVDSALATVSTTLDSATDTVQVLEHMVERTAKDTAMGLSMVYLEELPLVLDQARGPFLLARRLAAQVEPLDPVPVLVPAGRDVLTSLWLESQVSEGRRKGCPRIELLLSPTSCDNSAIK